MAIKHGRLAELWVKNAGGTYVNWHQYLDKINHPTTVDNPETTRFGATAKARIVGLEDTKLSCSGPRDVAFETLVYALKGSSVGYNFYPAGSVSGESKFDGTLMFASFESDSEAETANKMALELEVTDAVTRSVL